MDWNYPINKYFELTEEQQDECIVELAKFYSKRFISALAGFGLNIESKAAMTTVVGSFLTLENAIYTAEVVLTCTTLTSVPGSGLEPTEYYSIRTYSFAYNKGGIAAGDNPHNVIIDIDTNLGTFELLILHRLKCGKDMGTPQSR